MENTNKELLKTLLSRTNDVNKKVDELSRNHFEMSLKFSNYINAQDKENTYFKALLEGNDKTHQKGIVERVEVTESDIAVIKIDRKVTAGKIGIAGLIFTAVGTIILKLLGVVKFIL